MDDLHDRFDDWLAAGAEGEPPRDLAVHASGCDACLRSLAAIDSLQAIDIGAASLPPLGMVARAGRDGLARTLRYAVGVVAVVLLGTSVAVAASGLLRPTELGSAQETPSPAEGVLAGVPSAPAASQPDSEQPSASASDSEKPKQSPSEEPAVAVATPAPQVLPHSTPTPRPPGTPQPTAAATQTPAPTAAPTATPIVTPPPTPSASPSIVVPTPTPTLEPTPTASPTPPQCSDGLDNDDDLLVDFPSDPGCTAPDDDSEENFAP